MENNLDGTTRVRIAFDLELPNDVRVVDVISYLRGLRCLFPWRPVRLRTTFSPLLK